MEHPPPSLTNRVISIAFVASAALVILSLAPGRDYRDGTRGALAFLVAAAVAPHARLLFRTA
jgi:hypothetical protein